MFAVVVNGNNHYDGATGHVNNCSVGYWCCRKSVEQIREVVPSS